MELLDSYLKAVRRYLPRNQRDDIVAELSVELRSQIESREGELGRQLSDAEQMAILREQGDPMIVARRYRQNTRSLTIGWELIGPELFPMYLIILACNLSIAVLLTLAVLLYIHEPVRLSTLLRPVYIQIGVVTLIFTILNLVRRKSPQPWYYPPAELAPLIPVPRPYSAVGLALWAVFTIWWMLVPTFPGLLFGSASSHLALAPSWHHFYLPVLLLLAIGAGQRALNLACPQWPGILAVSRLFVNVVGLALQYPMIKAYPYVVAGDGANEHYRQLALVFNGSILWGLLSWLWGYLLISALVYAWYSLPHLRRLIRRQPSGGGQTRVLNGMV